MPVISLLGFGKLASICEFISSIASIFCYYNIGKKFNSGTGFAIVMALIPGVMLLIVVFSNDDGSDVNTPVSPNGPIEGKSNSSNGSNYSYAGVIDNNQNNNVRYCTNCSNKIIMDTKYCPNCGNEIN